MILALRVTETQFWTQPDVGAQPSPVVQSPNFAATLLPE